jgi:hypothetical protein
MATTVGSVEWPNGAAHNGRGVNYYVPSSVSAVARTETRCCSMKSVCSSLAFFITLLQTLAAFLAFGSGDPWIRAVKSSYVGNGRNVTEVNVYDLSGALMAFGTCTQQVDPRRPWIGLSGGGCWDDYWRTLSNSAVNSTALDLRAVGARAAGADAMPLRARVDGGILAGTVAMVLLVIQWHRFCSARDFQKAISDDPVRWRWRSFATMFTLLWSQSSFYAAVTVFDQTIQRPIHDYFASQARGGYGPWNVPASSAIYGYFFMPGAGYSILLSAAILSTIATCLYLIFLTGHVVQCSRAGPPSLPYVPAYPVQEAFAAGPPMFYPDPRMSAAPGYGYDVRGMSVPVAEVYVPSAPYSGPGGRPFVPHTQAQYPVYAPQAQYPMYGPPQGGPAPPWQAGSAYPSLPGNAPGGPSAGYVGPGGAGKTLD